MFNYSTSDKKPNGVVFHQTDNLTNYSARNEADYEINGGWTNAFVHTFIDASTILNIHDTDYGAWGAGPAANKRFVHFELVTARNFDEFARSISNAAWYVAYLSNKYQWTLSLASKTNLNASIWTHDDVSRYLGGTDHTDPIAHFNKWGYTMPQFLKLVQNYMQYDYVVSERNITDTQTFVGNGSDYIYDTAPKGSINAHQNMLSQGYNGKTVKILKELVLSNGEVWYYFTADNKYNFYAKSTLFTKNDSVSRNVTSVKRTSTKLVVNAQSGEQIFDNAPAGVPGAHGNSMLNHYNNKNATIDEELTLSDGEIWYHYSIDGKYWFYAPASGFKDTNYKIITSAKTVNYSKIVSANAGEQIFDNGPEGTKGAQANTMLNHYNTQDATIQKELTLSDGTVWYYYSVDNKFWFYAPASGFKDTNYKTITSTKTVNYSKIVAANAGEQIFNNGPEGTKGAKANTMLNHYNTQDATVKQELTVSDGTVWYYYSVDNKYWFYAPASGFKDANYKTITSTKTVNYSKIVAANAGEQIFNNGPEGTKGAKANTMLNHFNNQDATVTQELTVSDGTVWYYYSVDNKYWFYTPASGFKDTNYKTITSTKTVNYSKIVAANAGEQIFNNGSEGTKGAKANTMLNHFNNQDATVTQELTVSDGTVWYYYSVDNKYWFYAPASGFKDTNYKTITSTKTVNYSKIVAANAGEQIFNNGPEGTKGAKANTMLNHFNNQDATVTQELTVSDGTVWYYYSVDNKYWFYAPASGFKEVDNSVNSGNYYGATVSNLTQVQRNFLLTVQTGALSVANNNNLFASVIIAQAVCESAWGSSELAVQANNIFGIKADATWTGEIYTKKTQEFIDGKEVTVYADFRKYNSIQDSLNDYGVKMRTGSNYVGTWRENANSDCSYPSIWYINF